MPTAKERLSYVMERLTIADVHERKAVAFWLLDHYESISRTDVLMSKVVPVSNIEWQSIIGRINANEPVQYVTGETVFYGRTFTVTPDVLIPRPETEELVELVLKEISKRASPKVVDIGTGSGCIAVSIAAERANAHVTGFDISEKALAIATHNAVKNAVDVRFVQQDILNAGCYELFDVIVSNPPYVRASEAQAMSANVLEFEPHLALFVTDDQPLVFYEAIGQFAQKNLHPNGKILLEINEALGRETRECLVSCGFQRSEIIKDIHGKERFVVAAR